MYTESQIVARFYAKVKKGEGKNSCWEWQGTRNIRGYGRIVINYQRVFAHRLSWEIHNGEKLTDKKILVCHKCDNPGCVNPKHLFLGTSKDNIQDALNKGRLSQAKNLQKKIGVENGSARLTDEIVLQIRSDYANGEKQNCLAKKYGVARFTIWNIVHRNRWTHI